MTHVPPRPQAPPPPPAADDRGGGLGDDGDSSQGPDDNQWQSNSDARPGPVPDQLDAEHVEHGFEPVSADSPDRDDGLRETGKPHV